MSIPKVFISYSHDNLTHKKWVLDLAVRMRNNGIDAIIDQWELKPGDDLPHFMETQLALANKIIMVCSEKYVEKANSGQGGVGYEKMIITSNLLKNIDENKIIPIIKQASTKSVPTFLKTKLYIDFSKVDDFEYNFDELIRTIHESPILEKPPIGNNPFKQIESKSNSNDGLIDLIQVIAYEFNNAKDDYILYQTVFEALGVSRIYYDLLLEEAALLNYIEIDSDGDILLTTKGKKFALNNGLDKT